MWLGLIICERCFLVQRDSLCKAMFDEFFSGDEHGFVCGCARCGHWYAWRILI